MNPSNPPARGLRDFVYATLADTGGQRSGVPGIDPAIVAALSPMLIGWRPLTTNDLARNRVTDHTLEQLGRLYATSARHPDNPRNDPRRALPAAELALLWPAEAREARFGPLLRAGAEALLGERVQAAYDERIARWEEAFLLAGIADFVAESRQRQRALGRIGRALGVGIELLGLGADWCAGFLTARALTALEETAHRLESSPALPQILAQLGRVEAVEAALEYTLRPVVSTSAGGPSELRGLTLSGELSRLTPAALAGLGMAETEGAFLLGLVENRLMSWDLDGPTREQSAVGLRSLRRGGPIVVCIDTSASMDGDSESLAKATALAALRLALRQGRGCRLVSFSSALDWESIDAAALPDALPQILNFLLASFRGGTEPGAALLRLAASPAWVKRADVLLVSDGRFDPDELLRGAEALRAIGARTFGLLLGAGERADAFAGLDGLWTASAAGVVTCLRAMSNSQVT